MKTPLDLFSGMTFGISPQASMLAVIHHANRGTALVASGGQGHMMESDETKTTFHSSGTVVMETRVVRSFTFPFSAKLR
jgi:hypothetical protein